MVDTGPGIPLPERERAFDRFYRRSNAPEGGSGLGLAIVKAIADRHGAQIRLDDAPGGGLKVIVAFPGPASPRLPCATAALKARLRRQEEDVGRCPTAGLYSLRRIFDEISNQVCCRGSRGRVRHGAAAGWMTPGHFQERAGSGHRGERFHGERHPAAAPAGPIPLGTAPNYRAIVAQNRSSVVGITVAGELKAAAEQQQPFGSINPFGDDDNNPFSQFFRQMPHQHGNRRPCMRRARVSS